MTDVRAVVFDLDDTLFDHTSSATAGVRTWLTGLGATADDELLGQWFAIEQRHYPSWLAGELSHQEQRRRRLQDFLPLIGRPVPATPAEQDAAFAVYVDCYTRNWSAFPDARPPLEVARSNGWRVGVLTNGSSRQQNAKLARIGLAALVDVVSTSEDLGVGKPAAAAYHLTCAGLGVEPAHTLMVGDNLDLDVVAARAAGLSALHLDRAAGTTLTDLIRRTE